MRAKYIFVTEHTNRNDFLCDFENLSELLQKKYGHAKSENTFWKDDLYQDDFQEWGTAVAAGHMSRYASWETPTTEICHALSGDNFEIDHQIEYQSTQLKEMEESSIVQKTLNDL